jgi:hypothetical protein
MKQCHWTLYLVPIAAAIQVVMLAAGFLVLRAGTGSLNNENHLPRGSGYYVALVSQAPIFVYKTRSVLIPAPRLIQVNTL